MTKTKFLDYFPVAKALLSSYFIGIGPQIAEI